MMIIEIKEDKFEKMAEYTEKMLKYGGKLMSCISELGEEYGMSFREGDGGNYGNRGGRYGNRYDEMEMRGGYGSRGSMGYRHDDEDEDEWDSMNERRGGRRKRDSRGRYM